MDRQPGIQRCILPGLMGLVGSQQQGGDMWKGGVAPLQAGPPPVFIKHGLYVHSAHRKGLLDLHRCTRTMGKWRKMQRGRDEYGRITVAMSKIHWPQDFVALWPSGWACPPPDLPCYHDPESEYLEWSRFTNRMKRHLRLCATRWDLMGLKGHPLVTFDPVLPYPMHSVGAIAVGKGLQLTFPYSGQQVQATVCVQSLQQVLHSLRVWVVQLETQSIIFSIKDFVYRNTAVVLWNTFEAPFSDTCTFFSVSCCFTLLDSFSFFQTRSFKLEVFRANKTLSLKT